MKTAFEWFQNQYELLNLEQLALDLSPKQFNIKLTELFDKTKEKEKEQIILAGKFLPHDEQNEIKTPEDYYNQTYNQNK